jgi:hypothetical protein
MSSSIRHSVSVEKIALADGPRVMFSFIELQGFEIRALNPDDRCALLLS